MNNTGKKAEDSDYDEEADLDEWWSWQSVEEKQQIRSNFWRSL